MKDLIALIRSLTTKEKKYFRQTCTGESLLKLFSYIEKKNTITWQEVREGVPKNLVAYQSMLKEDILKCVRDFNDDYSESRSFDNLLHEIDILIGRELYELANKRLAKAQKMVVAGKVPAPKMLELTKLEASIISYLGTNDRQLQQIKRNNEVAGDCAFQKELEYLYYKSVVPENYQDNYSPLQEVKLLEEKYATKAEESFLTAILFLKTGIYSSYIKKQPEAQLDYTYRFLDYLSSNNEIVSGSLLDPSSSINLFNQYNFILASFETIKAQDYPFKKIVDAVNNIRKQTKFPSKKVDINFTLTVSRIFVEKRMIADGLAFLKNTVKDAAPTDKEVASVELIRFRYGLLLFYDGNYAEAKKEIFSLQQEKLTYHEDMRKICAFFYTILQLELKKIASAIDYLNSFVINLSRNKKYNPFDQAIVAFIRAYSLTNTSKMQDAYAKVKTLLEQSSEEKHSTYTTIYVLFDFVTWMETKLAELK